MPAHNRVAVFSLVSILVLLISLASPILAQADDGAPPAEPTTETQVTEETPPVEPVEDVSIPEVLEQAPEGTEIVVLDASGAEVPLATEEAAEIVAVSDPMWCPDGVTPGDALCSPAQDSMTDLITWLVAEDPDADGTIWIEGSYDSGTNVDDTGLNFSLDGGSFATMDLHSLTFQGGWSGGNDTNVDMSDPSEFNGSLFITSWQNDVILSDLLVLGTSDVGLFVDTTGDVTVERVESSSNDLDGMVVYAGGEVSINDSTFDENGDDGYTYTDEASFYYSGGSGLWVESDTGVTLTSVYATDNAMNGAVVFTFGDADVAVDDSGFVGNGYDYSWLETAAEFSESTMVFEIDYAGGDGLFVETQAGDISLVDIYATENANHGAELFSDDGDISVSGSDFEGNGWIGEGKAELSNGETLDEGEPVFLYNSVWFESTAGDGLNIKSDSGSVTLTELYVDSNANNGAKVDTEGYVEVSDSLFAGNGWSSGIFDGCECFSGYDILEMLLFDPDDYLTTTYDVYALCEVNNAPGFDDFLFDPCDPDHIDFLDVYGPNFYFEASEYLSDTETDYYNTVGWDLGVIGGEGLLVFAEDGVKVDEVVAYENSGDGAYLASYGSGALIEVTDSGFYANGWMPGLLAGEATFIKDNEYGSDLSHGLTTDIFYGAGLVALNFSGDVTLNSVEASYNADDGAGILSDGDVSVVDGEFDENGYGEITLGGEGFFGSFFCDEIGFCDEVDLDSSTLEIELHISEGVDAELGPYTTFNAFFEASAGSGLDVFDAEGDITLYEVFADDNNGYGASLVTDSAALVTYSKFDDNGYGMQAFVDICVSDLYCEYFETYFSGSSGLFVDADGDITLLTVDAGGNALHGAELYSDAIDSIVVTEGTFSNNGYGSDAYHYYEDDFGYEAEAFEGSGLFANTSGNIVITDGYSAGNDAHGVHLISGGYAAICDTILENNGDYGAEAGDVAGSLTLSDVVFGGNGSGDYNYPGTANVTTGADCFAIGGGGGGGGGHELPWNHVPVDGGEQVGLDCTSFAGTILELDSGDHAVLPCPIRDTGLLTQSLNTSLPGDVPEGFTFKSGMTLDVLRDGGSVELIEDGFVTIAFVIPDGVSAKDLKILWWNGAEWVALDEVSGAGRVVGHAGFVTDDGFFAATVNFTGTFILVQK